jgi:hypothetical protein
MGQSWIVEVFGFRHILSALREACPNGWGCSEFNTTFSIGFGNGLYTVTGILYVSKKYIQVNAASANPDTVIGYYWPPIIANNGD